MGIIQSSVVSCYELHHITSFVRFAMTTGQWSTHPTHGHGNVLAASLAFTFFFCISCCAKDDVFLTKTGIVHFQKQKNMYVYIYISIFCIFCFWIPTDNQYELFVNSVTHPTGGHTFRSGWSRFKSSSYRQQLFGFFTIGFIVVCFLTSCVALWISLPCSLWFYQ